MDNTEKLLALRKRIPEFKCLPNCGECCTSHTTMSDMEAKRITSPTAGPPDFACGNIDFFEYCMFLSEDMRCTVHGERPIRCRTFGCTDTPGSLYVCPHGAKPEKPWSEGKVQEVLREYEEITKGQNEFITFGLIDKQMKPITRGKNG